MKNKEMAKTAHFNNPRESEAISSQLEQNDAEISAFEDFENEGDIVTAVSEEKLIDIEDEFKKEIEEYKLPSEIKDRLASEKNAIEKTQSLSSRFRAELEQYLTVMESKTSEADGEKLVKVPKNFNTIVNAMTREDLFDDNQDTGNNSDVPENNKEDTPVQKKRDKPPLPHQSTSKGSSSTSETLPAKYQDFQQLKKKNKQAWYRYLMEDYINKDMNEEYEGRYSNILLPPSSREAQVQKGLAEILLLDRELYNLTKKAELIFPDDTPRSGREDMSSRGGDPMTPYSTSSRQGYFDKTFITKEKNRSFSNTTTPRSPAAISKHSSLKKDSKSSPEGKKRGDSSDEDEESGNGSNTAAIYGKKKLTDAQQKHLEELLAIEDDHLADQLPYLSSEDQVLDHELTEKLSVFGRLDRLELPSYSELDSGMMMTMSEGKKKKVILAKLATKDDGNDYLRQQREERKEKEYAKKIESFLQQLTGVQEADYRHFFEEDSQSIGGRSQCSRALHEVPLASEVRLDVPITKEDINQLVSNLKRDLGFSSTATPTSSSSSRAQPLSDAFFPLPSAEFTSSSMVPPSKDSFMDGFSSHQMIQDLPSTGIPPPSPSQPPLSSSSSAPVSLLAGKEEIHKLLSSLQTEMQRLQLYRSKFETGKSQEPQERDKNEEIISRKNQSKEEEADFEEEEIIEAGPSRSAENEETERPFSPTDFQMIPSYLRVQPPPPHPDHQTVLTAVPPAMPTQETESSRLQSFLPPIHMTTLQSRESHSSKSTSRSNMREKNNDDDVYTDSQEQERESSNPYSIHRRVRSSNRRNKPSQPISSTSSHQESPRRRIYQQQQQVSSYGEDSGHSGAEDYHYVTYGSDEEVEEDNEEEGGDSTTSQRDRRIGRQEDGTEDSELEIPIERSSSKKQMLVEKVRQFVQI